MKQRDGKDATPPDSYFADFSSSYGGDVDRILSHLLQIEPRILDDTSKFADTFYRRLGDRAESAAILARLSSDEMDHLKLKQAAHLKMLLSPGITALEQYERAKRVGWIHEMVGVSLPMLMETYHLYHSKIEEILSSAVLTDHQSDRLRSALHQRMQLDVEAQIASHARFEGEIAFLLAALDEAIQKAGNLTDILRYTFKLLGISRASRHASSPGLTRTGSCKSRPKAGQRVRLTLRPCEHGAFLCLRRKLPLQPETAQPGAPGVPDKSRSMAPSRKTPPCTPGAMRPCNGDFALRRPFLSSMSQVSRSRF